MRSHPANLSEQRREQRFKARLPVDLGFAQGFTRDLSASGCFVEADVSRSAAQEVLHFTLKLIGGERPVQRRCTGRIVRIADDGSGMAVHILESVMLA